MCSSVGVCVCVSVCVSQHVGVIECSLSVLQ